MALSPTFVHARLHDADARFRWSSAGRALLAGTAAALFFLIVFLGLDTAFHLGAFGRWLGFACIVAPLAAGIAGALPAWRRPFSELAIARRIEEACPGAGNALINAVQFDRELAPGSPLRAAVFNELADPFSRVNWRQVFDLRLLRRLGIAFAVAAVVVFGWALARPAAFVNSVARVFLPASRIAPLTRTRLLALTPGDAGVTHGGELDLSARLGGDIPRTAWVRYREAGSGWKRELLNREVGTTEYAFAWKDVRQPMEYYVEAGDFQSAVYRVTVRAHTAIALRTAEIVPPAYTALPRRTVKGFQALDGLLPGSRVELTLDFNNPVDSLRASEANQPPLPGSRIDDRHWRVAVPILASSHGLTLTFHDLEGSTTSDTLPMSVKADEAPKITVTDPVEGREIVAAPTGALDVRFSASDDFGLRAVALYRSTPEKADAELVQDFPAAAGQKAFAGSARVPLGRFVKPGEDRVSFALVARDANDVSGPGVTISRPLTVSLGTAENVRQQAAAATAKLMAGLQDLLRLQQTNLEATQTASANAPAATAPALAALLDREVAVGDQARDLAAGAGDLAPAIRETLRALSGQEIPAAVLALRDATGAVPAARGALLGTAAGLETLILARLRGSPARAEEEAKRGVIRDVIAGVDGLLREQRAILKDTPTATTAAASGPLSKRQDALADQTVAVRKSVEKNAGDASLGEPDFRARLGRIAAMFGEFKLYEQMLVAADALDGRKLAAAADTETAVAANLTKMVDLLNQWQLAQAGAEAEKLRAEAEKMKAKLDKLAELQREVLEKSKDLARKDQFSPEDRSTAQEIQRTKDLMAKVVEGMLTDATVFPEMNISNQLRTMLTTVFEDVKQTDLDAIAKKALKPQDIAVQKEDSLMKAIEETKKIPEDMEMYLPKTSNTSNWLLENFDKTEIPKLDNLPLPDELTDLIGELQKEQEDIADKVQGAASNQIMKAMQQGGPVTDGPQSGYSAQGKSNNQKPLDIEQSGRSSGGREGESNGEMVGKSADDLEGRKTHARRTSDAMQSGAVDDPSNKTHDAKATGGGKASGFSQREGMDGDAPLRGSNAPRQGAADAATVAQALLAAKTSQKAAAASLLYLRSDRLSDVAGLMQESESALREGRLADFQGLHKKIVAQLNAAKGEMSGGKVLSLATHETARAEDAQVLGGGEGEAPAPYKDRVADYYRSLTEGK